MSLVVLCVLWWGLAIGSAQAAEVMPEVRHDQSASESTEYATSSDAPETCWDSAARLHHVNVEVLVAIAQVESSFRASAINRNRNGSADIGIMQINSSWLPTLKRYGISRADLFDPCVNVHVGAWILGKNFRHYGQTSWRAVGAYNATSVDRQLAYALKVQRRLRRSQRSQ